MMVINITWWVVDIEFVELHKTMSQKEARARNQPL
jgi:hypothetical protein